MEWNNKISENVQAVPFSGIRKFFDLASTMKDVISLGVGEPDYAAPDRVIDACIESLKNKETSYTSNWGLLELREEISCLFKKRYDYCWCIGSYYCCHADDPEPGRSGFNA